MVQILRFSPTALQPADWSQREIAEFYRVENALTQAGISLDIERGLTDEGDPWFAFCRRDNGEVFVHFARIDGEYIIDGTGFGGIARGRDFSALIRTLISGEALQLAKLRPANSNVFLHPAALLIALVGAAFFHSSDVKAAESAGQKIEVRRVTGFLVVSQDRNLESRVGLDAAQAATVMAGILIGIDEQRMLPIGFAVSASIPFANLPSSWEVLPADSSHTASAHASIAILPLAAGSGEVQFFAPPPSTMPIHSSAATSSQSESDNTGVLAVARSAAPAMVTFAPPNAPAPLSAGADHPLPLAVDVSALPSDEAGQLVSALASNFGPHAVSLTFKLPALMEDLVKHGSTSVAAQAAPPSATLTATEIPTSAIPATSAAATSSPAAPALSHDAAIDQVVSTFMDTVVHWGVAVSDGNIVVYDEDIFGPHTGALDSQTYIFSDGSQISLVGTQAEIANAHLPQ